MRKFTVKEADNTRLDVFLKEKLPEYSRAYLQKLTKNQKILVNKEPARSSYKLRVADIVTVDLEIEESDKPKSLDLKIVYEDDDCLVLIKPEGILSHSKGVANPEATVETFIEPYIHGFSGDRAGIVHRLDRATSGVMITAKHPEAFKLLQKEFSTRKAKKTYYAIVSGHFKEPEAIIDMAIGRNPKAPATFRVSANGKTAQTAYRVIKESNHYTLVEMKPKTGRTHQLRVHLSHIGHPILGDFIYHGAKADRTYLHAYSLELTLPNGDKCLFEAKLPNSFDKVMDSDE